jgi:general secretion pathway protein A
MTQAGYISYYGLKAEPFRLTPDPQFLHLSETHKKAFTIVMEGILHRKGLVMITGPIGTGKTTILNAALQILSDESKVHMLVRTAFLFNPMLSRDDFFEVMLDDFKVTCSATGKGGRLMALYKMLFETQQRGGTAVLLIDEAHLLTSELLEEIRLLGNADTHQAKMLQIVLCGQPELAQFMNRRVFRALRQRIAAVAVLRPLNAQESRGYIAERLYLGGLRGDSPFSEAALDAIARYSQGVPRVINLICDACLNLGFRIQSRTFSSEMVEDVTGSLGLMQLTADGEKKAVKEAVHAGDFVPNPVVQTMIEAMQQTRSAQLGSMDVQETGT